MKHLAAYLLLVLGGNVSPTAKDIKNVLEAVGIEADENQMKKLLGELKGKDLNEVCFFLSFSFFSPCLLLSKGQLFEGGGEEDGSRLTVGVIY